MESHTLTTHQRSQIIPAPTDIDHDAPVLAQHQIDIAATLATVWGLHINVDDWPRWNLEITAAALVGDFSPGSSFTWTSWGFTVTSTIHAVEDHRRTLWGGAAQGIMGTHEWLFAETLTGVHVVTNESFSGAPAQADPHGLRGTLDTSLTSWLARLKTQAESVA
jgi:hypothetical protein